MDNQLLTIAKLAQSADEIKCLYADLNQQNGHHPWGLAEYMQGFVGDVGALAKLVMAKTGYRDGDDVDERLAHELVDCLWSVLVIANEVGIDLGTTFMEEMGKLEKRITATSEPE